MAAAPLILSIAGLGVGVAGQIQSARAQGRAAEASQRVGARQAELAEYNAQVAELQAEDARRRGDLEVSRFRQQVRGLIGRQRAGQGASGIDVNYGTPVDVVADTAFQGEQDARTILLNADREAWGFEVEAVDLRERADLLREEGANAAEVGRANARATSFGAASTLLAGSANLLDAHYGFTET